MSNNVLQNDEIRPEVDVLLHEYFEAEMPKPWPAFKAPLQVRAKKQATFWSQYSGRLALAASVALLVAGYLTLGGFFSNSSGLTGVERGMESNIGQRDKAPKATNPTPMPDRD
jgi:hypothetical protein